MLLHHDQPLEFVYDIGGHGGHADWAEVAKLRGGSMKIEVPPYPTHALRLRCSVDGEGYVIYVFAFKVGEEFYDHDTGNSVLVFEGDEVIASWALS